MRQREEDAIQIFQRRGVFGSCREVKISQAVKVSMNFTDGLAGLLIRRDKNDFNIRMEEKKAQQF
jgi:hypothetical protein